VEEVFGTVLIVIAVLAAVVAAVSYWGSGRIYRGLGRSGAFSMDEPQRRPAPEPASAAASAEAREEIRQMLEAKLAGQEIKRPEPAPETPVVDLMEALRRSVQQVEEDGGKKARAAAKKPAARSRSRATAKK
jgi:hypothetical protein